MAEVYAQNAELLWKSLFRMGIPEADLPDALQEVLLVVHRRLDTYDRSCRLSTWLFGICLRVASTQRRTRRRRREESMDPDVQLGPLVDHQNPEELAVARDARRRFDAALASLDPEKRAIFTMFEIDGFGCAAIAEMLGVPKGTVFSRLSAARQAFQASLARQSARDSNRVRASGGGR